MMKYLLSIIIFVLFSCQSKEQTVENQLPERNIEQVVEYYDNGLKKMEGELLNGQRHGKWFAYYENGMKWSEGNFNKGLRVGLGIVYYENGKKKLEGLYDQDKKVGIWKVWEDDGTLVQEIDMDNPINASDSLRLEAK
ncbi:MAG: hypothetical protein DWP98_06330 [Bacteroidetes bacterium]|nr:MAG: hypothetical protein DWP98_06330 [Bacteroidota bacterium]MBL1143356.1 hypothetical protein [Bacteroidota bacterium]NOG56158.1 hypothetical protein [Bacteroidota bacterium]